MSFQKRDLTECELEQMLEISDYVKLRALFKLYDTMKVISKCQRTQIEDRLQELEPPLGRNGRCPGGSYGGTGKRSRATRRNGNLRKRRSRKGRRTSRKGKL
jgi:hypothetical protein